MRDLKTIFGHPIQLKWDHCFKNVKYLLYVIDIFTNYAWVKSLNDKNRKTALNAFIEIVNESNKKTNEFWLDQGKEFYNKVMQE